MMRDIYVRLMDEGTTVYRPVPSFAIADDIYQIDGFDIYDAEDEVWEFAPGVEVAVEQRYLGGEICLVAIKRHSPVFDDQ